MDLSKIREISLTTLANGGAVERFDDELQAVLKNILDVNTDANAKRSIKLTAEFEPSDDRKSMTIKIKCESKMAAPKAISSFGYIGTDGKNVVATEFNPSQGELPFVVPSTTEKQ